MSLLAYNNIKHRREIAYLDTLPTLLVSREDGGAGLPTVPPRGQRERNREEMSRLLDSNAQYTLSLFHGIASPHQLFRLTSNSSEITRLVGDSSSTIPQAVDLHGNMIGIYRAQPERAAQWNPFLFNAEGNRLPLRHLFQSILGAEAQANITTFHFSLLKGDLAAGSVRLHRAAVPFILNLRSGELTVLPTLSALPSSVTVIDINKEGWALGREVSGSISGTGISYLLWKIPRESARARGEKPLAFDLEDVVNKTPPANPQLTEVKWKLSIENLSHFTRDGASFYCRATPVLKADPFYQLEPEDTFKVTVH